MKRVQLPYPAPVFPSRSDCHSPFEEQGKQPAGKPTFLTQELETLDEAVLLADLAAQHLADQLAGLLTAGMARQA